MKLHYFGGDFMDVIESSKELMEHIDTMDRENSVIQFSIPGKEKFTLVLQEADEDSISSDIEKNSQLKQKVLLIIGMERECQLLN